MKKLFLFLHFTFCIFTFAFSQNPLVKQWDYRFGGTNWDLLYSFQQTAEGGYILGGYSNSGISGDKTQSVWGTVAVDNDYWVVKTDSLGIKQWDKDFGGINMDALVSLQQTVDGGYIIGGFSSSGISGNKTQATWGGYDYWIIKTDSLGIKQWDKDYGTTGSDQLGYLQQTADGGYILGGYSNSGISGDKTQANWDTTGNTSDFWIVKTDSLGNKQWDKSYGGTANDILFFLQQTTDRGYILGGISHSGINGDKTQANWDPSGNTSDHWIVKIDSLGNKQWDKDYGGTDTESFTSMTQTADGGYILGGCSFSGISGDKTQPLWGGYDYWIVKTDSLGSKQWDKDFGGTGSEDEFSTIVQTADKGYLIGGTSYSNISGDKTENNLGTEQSWILKTDSLGNKQWDKTLLTNCVSVFHDEAGLAIQTKDGCYAMANYTNTPIGGDKTQPAWNGSFDYWMIKFCDTTSTIGISDLQFSNTNFQIIPNPSNGSLLVSGLKFPVERIEIFNLLGETVFTKQPGTRNPKLEIHLSNGIYIIKAYTDKGVFQQKLIVNH